MQRKYQINKKAKLFYIVLFASLLVLFVSVEIYFLTILFRNFRKASQGLSYLYCWIMITSLSFLLIFGINECFLELISLFKFGTLAVELQEGIIISKNDTSYQIPNNKGTYVIYHGNGLFISWLADDVRYQIYLKNIVLPCEVKSFLKNNFNYISRPKEKKHILDLLEINRFKRIRYIAWPPLDL